MTVTVQLCSLTYHTAVQDSREKTSKVDTNETKRSKTEHNTHVTRDYQSKTGNITQTETKTYKLDTGKE